MYLILELFDIQCRIAQRILDSYSFFIEKMNGFSEFKIANYVVNEKKLTTAWVRVNPSFSFHAYRTSRQHAKMINCISQCVQHVVHSSPYNISPVYTFMYFQIRTFFHVVVIAWLCNIPYVSPCAALELLTNENQPSVMPANQSV